MIRYQAVAFVNECPDHRFSTYEGTRFGDGHNCPVRLAGSFAIEGESVEDALDRVLWPVGNKEGADLDGREWPRSIRSLSVSDIAVVNGIPYLVDHVGWKRLHPFDVMPEIREARPTYVPCAIVSCGLPPSRHRPLSEDYIGHEYFARG